MLEVVFREYVDGQIAIKQGQHGYQLSWAPVTKMAKGVLIERGEKSWFVPISEVKHIRLS